MQYFSEEEAKMSVCTHEITNHELNPSKRPHFSSTLTSTFRLKSSLLILKEHEDGRELGSFTENGKVYSLPGSRRRPQNSRSSSLI